MAYDPSLGAVILFGGDRLGVEMADTWEWKSGSWTDLSSKLSWSPPGKYDGVMAWDPAVSAIVLFGGSDCVLAGCTYTYEFNGTWHQLSTSVAPTPNVDFGLAYDDVLGCLILSSGQAYHAQNDTWYGLNETWEFNGTAWIQLHPTHSPPPEQQVVMAYDDLGGYILDFPLGTGATWIYQAGDWTNLTASIPVSPSPRSSPAFAMDEADGYVLMMGGASGVRSGDGAGANSTTVNDTWAWKGGVLFALATASPSAADTNTTVQFNVNRVVGGALPYTFAWLFGDGGSSALRNVSHSFTSAGTFLAIVWANDSSANSTNSTVRVTVNPYPSVAAAAAPSVVDSGRSVDFAAAVAGGTPPFHYTWKFGDGNTSSDPTPVHTYTAGGNFVANVTVRDSGGGVSNASTTVVVNPALRVANLTANPDPAGLGGAVNFSAIATGGASPYTYSWTFGDGGIGGDLENITHIFTSTGSFLTTVDVRDFFGEVARRSITMNVTFQVGLLATFSVLQVGQVTEITPVISGGKLPYSITWPGLPAWCTFRGSLSGGAVHCVPTSAGEFGITIRGVDASGATATASLTLFVQGVAKASAGSPGPPLVTGTVLATAAGISGSAGLLVGWSLARRGRRRGSRPPSVPTSR